MNSYKRQQTWRNSNKKKATKVINRYHYCIIILPVFSLLLFCHLFLIFSMKFKNKKEPVDSVHNLEMKSTEIKLITKQIVVFYLMILKTAKAWCRSNLQEGIAVNQRPTKAILFVFVPASRQLRLNPHVFRWTMTKISRLGI